MTTDPVSSYDVTTPLHTPFFSSLLVLSGMSNTRRDLHEARRESISRIVSDADELGSLFHHED